MQLYKCTVTLNTLSIYILQVQTKLQNPTHFHVQQNQKKQIQMFFGTSSDKVAMIQSLPNPTTGTLDQNKHSSSMPDPDSPLSAGLSSSANSVPDVSPAAF